MEQNIVTKIEALIASLEEAKADAERHDKQQKAAGTRLRGTLQGIKKSADLVRKDILAEQKSWK